MLDRSTWLWTIEIEIRKADNKHIIAVHTRTQCWESEYIFSYEYCQGVNVAI